MFIPLIGKSSKVDAPHNFLDGVNPDFDYATLQTLHQRLLPTKDTLKSLYKELNSMTWNEKVEYFSLLEPSLILQRYVNVCKDFYQLDLAIVFASWIFAWHCMMFINVRVPFINKAVYLHGANAYNVAKQLYSDFRLSGGPVDPMRAVHPWPGYENLNDGWGRTLTIFDMNTDIQTQMKNKIWAQHSGFSEIEYNETIRTFIASQNSTWFDSRGPLIVLVNENNLDTVKRNEKVLEFKC